MAAAKRTARRRCECGEAPQPGLPRCRDCHRKAREAVIFADGRSLGRAEGEVLTWEFLRRTGRLLDGTPPPASPVVGIQMTERQWRQLVQLCHPDVHDGSAASESATKWLNSIRNKVTPP